MTAAETEIHRVAEQLEILASSETVSVRETQAIKDLAQDAREQEAYNRVYSAALPLAREAQASEDSLPLDMFFAAVRS